MKKLFSMIRSRSMRKGAGKAARMGRKQNKLAASLSDEAFDSAGVAHALAVIGREKYGSTVDPAEIAAAALFHDVWGGETPKYNVLFAFETDKPEFARYLRAADLIAAYLRCAEEVRQGNGAYEEAEFRLLEGIHELELPEAEDYLARLHTKESLPEELRQEE